MRAPSKAFSQACGIYRSDVSFLLVNSGRGAASRPRAEAVGDPVLGAEPLSTSTAGPTGPAQAIGRAGRNAPFPSSAMSSGRLFLGGLLASRARFRFTDTARIELLPCSAKGPIIEP